MTPCRAFYVVGSISDFPGRDSNLDQDKIRGGPTMIDRAIRIFLMLFRRRLEAQMKEAFSKCILEMRKDAGFSQTTMAKEDFRFLVFKG